MSEACTTHGSAATFTLDAGSVCKLKAVVGPAVALKFAVVFENTFIFLNFGFNVAKVFTGSISRSTNQKYIACTFCNCTPQNISKRPADRLTVFAGFYEHGSGKFFCRFEQFLIFLTDKRLECVRHVFCKASCIGNVIKNLLVFCRIFIKIVRKIITAEKAEIILSLFHALLLFEYTSILSCKFLYEFAHLFNFRFVDY